MTQQFKRLVYPKLRHFYSEYQEIYGEIEHPSCAVRTYAIKEFSRGFYHINQSFTPLKCKTCCVPILCQDGRNCTLKVVIGAKENSYDVRSKSETHRDQWRPVTLSRTVEKDAIYTVRDKNKSMVF